MSSLPSTRGKNIQHLSLATIASTIANMILGAAPFPLVQDSAIEKLSFKQQSKPAYKDLEFSSSSGGLKLPPKVQIINVKDFGARGDNYTDDSVAIQTALNAAAIKKDSVVIVPPGIYLCRSPLSVASNTTIKGVGSASLKASGIGQLSVISLENSQSSSLLNVHIDGGQKSIWGIDAIGASNCIIDSVRVTNTKSHAIVIRSGSSNCKVSNSTITQCGGGITLSGAPYSSIERCVVRNINSLKYYMGSIYIVNSPNSRIKDNHIVKSNANGLFIESSSNSAVVGNTLKNHGSPREGGRGIFHGSAPSVGIVYSANRVSNSWEQGIFDTFSRDSLFSNNLLIDNNTSIGSVALEAGAGSKRIIGNYITGKAASGTKGIFVSGKNNIVIGNFVEGMPSHGIQCWGTQDSIINSNVVKNAGKYGIDLNHNSTTKLGKMIVCNNYCIDTRSPRIQLKPISISPNFNHPVLLENGNANSAQKNLTRSNLSIDQKYRLTLEEKKCKLVGTTVTYTSPDDDTFIINQDSPSHLSIFLPAHPEVGRTITIRNERIDTKAKSKAMVHATTSKEGKLRTITSTPNENMVLRFDGHQWISY